MRFCFFKGMRLLIIAGSCLCLAGFANADSVFLSITQEPDEQFTGKQNIAVNHDQSNLVVLGVFNDAKFSIDNVSQIQLVAQDDSIVPITIDEASLVKEFGKIISVALCFQIPEQAVNAGASYELKWGAGIASNNKLVKGIGVLAESLKSARGFSWTASRDQASGQHATIEVIVDSYADYYSLWYLLPVLLIFGLLTVRKFRRNEASSRE